MERGVGRRVDGHDAEIQGAGEPDADLQQAVLGQGASSPRRSTAPDRAADREPTKEDAQRSRGGVSRAAEEQRQLAHPEHLVDEAGESRHKEQAENREMGLVCFGIHEIDASAGSV